MKTTNTNAATIATAAAQAAAAVLNAGGTEEQAAAAASSIFAALSDTAAARLVPMAIENVTPQAPKAPKQAKTPKAPKAKAPQFVGGEWVTFIDMSGAPQMCKARATGAGIYLKNTHISDAQSITKHATQGKALQALNAMRKAQDAPQAPEAPKPEAVQPEAPADLDERAQRIAKKNAAIIATAPEANRRIIESKLKQAHKAGYPYARLERNKRHQLDGLHLYPGTKGHGRDPEFMALVTKAGAKHRAKADEAAAQGKTGANAPKPPARVWYWSPRGGGNLYIRGIFGEMSDK